MIRIIFKITLDDDKIYYTADRNDVVNKINDFHKDDETFKKYNINTINGVLYIYTGGTWVAQTDPTDQETFDADRAKRV